MTINSKEQLAGMIDHTFLSATAIEQDIRRICQEAIDYGFCTVCVNPRWVALVADILHGTAVKVCSVAGFPLGADSTKIKAAQAKEVIMAGADEVDTVADVASIISGDENYLRKDFSAVLDVCRSMRPAVTLKVIIESAALTEEQIQFVCQIADRVGIDFVKTSTGLNPAGGATPEAVTLMAQSSPNCKIKAAGGIRTTDQAIAMIEAGASRIGCSASVDVVEGFTSKSTE